MFVNANGTEHPPMDDANHFNNSFLTKGSQVEVSSNEDGLSGAWFVATVIHPPPPPPISTLKKNRSQNYHTCNNLVYVEYHNLLCEDGSSTRLREYANVSHVRPSPRPDTNDAAPNFQINDLVDAFYRDGWWTGIITQVLDTSNFLVTFLNPPDQIQFHFFELRLHRKWVAGRWVQPEKQRTAGLMFTAGKKVEVSFDRENLRDVWLPAIVLKNSGNNSFLVEYQQRGVGDEPALHKATVDYHHIRPSPPHLRDKNFVLLEKVDAYYDFGWWSGVITKELADNRYSVFFKHTQEEREFIYPRVRPHMEWKGGKWFNTSQGDMDGRTNCSLMDKKQPSIVVPTSITKRTKQTNLVNNLLPAMRRKDDDPSKKTNGPPLGQSEGLDSVITNDQAFGITENLSHGKKVCSKRGKGVELETPTTEFSGKKRRFVNELKRLKASGEGGKSDSVKTSRGRKIEQLASERFPKTAKDETKKPGVPLEVMDKEAESIAPKKKRGRPPKIQVISLETPVTVNHQNGVVEGSQSKEIGSGTKSLEDKQVPVEEEPLPKSCKNDENPGQDLNVQRGWEKCTSIKGKRGRRRTISINTESPAQDSQELSKETEDGCLEDSATRNPVGKSLDSVSDDQPISRWLVHPVPGPEESCDTVAGVANSPPPFVRNTQLWHTIESMEAFRKIPQKPHFCPLFEGVKESAREGLAIGSMVTFSTVVEKTCGLRYDDPRSAIEDCLETLVELESHGFDVEVIRDRLTRLLLIKDKQEELEERSKGVAAKIEEHTIQAKRMDEEIIEIDRQTRELEERRRQVLLKKDTRDLEIGVVKAAWQRIEQDIREVGVEFDGLVAAPL